MLETTIFCGGIYRVSSFGGIEPGTMEHQTDKSMDNELQTAYVEPSSLLVFVGHHIGFGA